MGNWKLDIMAQFFFFFKQEKSLQMEMYLMQGWRCNLKKKPSD